MKCIAIIASGEILGPVAKQSGSELATIPEGYVVVDVPDGVDWRLYSLQPDGSVAEDAARVAAERTKKAQTDIAAIKARLVAIDEAGARPARAVAVALISNKIPNAEDSALILRLEADAVSLREQIMQIQSSMADA